MPVGSRLMRKCWRAALFSVAIVCLPAGCATRHELPPTPKLFLVSEEDPFAETPPAFQSSRVDLLYVTDRAPIETADGSIAYGHGRSRTMALGRCVVETGRDLAWEELVEESRNARHRRLPMRVVEIEELVRFPDASLIGDRTYVNVAADEAYAAAMAEANEQAGDIVDERLLATPLHEVYLFVHGYNNTFEDAACRMAQLWHFLGRRGVPMLYSWPAGRGGLRGYGYDRESGEFTVFHLKQVLRGVEQADWIDRLHIIAHSRGCDVVMTALRELHIEYRARGVDTAESLKLANLILAAPDIDMEVLTQRIGAEGLLSLPDRFTIYLAADDRAIGFAAWFMASVRRLGRLNAADFDDGDREALRVMDRLQLVDVAVRTDFFNHAYFIANPYVLSDLILVLRHDLPPGREHGRPLVRHETGLWRLYTGYPKFDESLPPDADLEAVE
jgi:esterase/lipase superfamily enzyme